MAGCSRDTQTRMGRNMLILLFSVISMMETLNAQDPAILTWWPLNSPSMSASTISCPSGWELSGSQCFKFFDLESAWNDAYSACQGFGATLATPTDANRNAWIASTLVGPNAPSGVTQFWIGLNTIDAPTEMDGFIVGPGDTSSATKLDVGYWAKDQPDPSIGSCAAVQLAAEWVYPWSLQRCDTRIPFVCQAPACILGPTGGSPSVCTFADGCSNDMQCGDGSCNHEHSGTTGTIVSGAYQNDQVCTWTIEGPVGSNIKLSFTDFDTEAVLDYVDIFHGARTVADSDFITSLSGANAGTSTQFFSKNNLMILRLTSDLSVTGTGFTATWTTEYPCVMKSITTSENSAEPYDTTSETEDACQSSCLNDAQCNSVVFNNDDNSCKKYAQLGVAVEANCCTYYGKTCPGKAGSTSEQTIPNNGGTLQAIVSEQDLYSPHYPFGSVGNSKYVWIIEASEWSIITLQRHYMNLGPDDEVIIRDGKLQSDPILASYTSGGNNPDFVISSGPIIFIEHRVNSVPPGKGFYFTYMAGCTVRFEADSGVIQSPGYGSGNYPDVVECSWSISSSNGGSLKVDFDPADSFALAPTTDTLMIYLGEDETGTLKDTYTSSNTAGTSFEAPGGKVYFYFKTDASQNEVGFRASFSVGCMAPPIEDVNIQIYQMDGVTPIAVADIPTEFGSQFVMKCEENYSFLYEEYDMCMIDVESRLDIECVQGGVWNVGKFPTCIERHCGPVVQPSGGKVVAVTNYLVGGIATFECFDGYSIIENGQTTCDPTGNWINYPTCDAVKCERLPGTGLSNGLVEYSYTDNPDPTDINDLVKLGNVLTFSCEPGFILNGNHAIYCTSDGSYSGEVPTCQPIHCDILEIENGSHDKLGQRTIAFEEIITYSCNEGFTVTGDSQITCNSTGVLNTRPVCENVNECDANPCSDMAAYSPQAFNCTDTIGSFYCSCAEGYLLVGTVCQDIDECESDQGCDFMDPNTIYCTNNEGSHSCSGCSSSAEEPMTTNPQNGYSLLGTETGTEPWNIFRLEHTCIRVKCDKTFFDALPSDATLLSNGQKTTATEQEFIAGDVVTVLCNQGFSITGNQIKQDFTCSETGWNPATMVTCSTATCPVVTAPAQPFTPSGLPTTATNYGSSVDFTCNVDGREAETRSLTCSWNNENEEYNLLGDSLDCGAIECGDYVSSLPGTDPTGITDTHYKISGTSFMFGCAAGFTLTGSSNLASDITVRCQGDGTWDLGDLKCSGPICSDPGQFVDTIRNIDGFGFEDGQTVTYTCIKPGFTPDNPVLTCNSGSWSPTSVSCVDDEDPTFDVNAPCDMVLYFQKYEPVVFDWPVASDNDGLVSTAVTGGNLGDLMDTTDIVYTFTATDRASRTATCIITARLKDEIKPVITQCHTDVTEAVQSALQDSVYVFDIANSGTTVVATDTSDITYSFEPAIAKVNVDAVGSPQLIAMVVTDESGNEARCYFNFEVIVETCDDNAWFLHTPLNGDKVCNYNIDNPTQYECVMTCNPGYIFHDDADNTKTYSCSGNDWYLNGVMDTYVPDCIESLPGVYTLDLSMVYRSEVPISESCQQPLFDAVVDAFASVATDLTQNCDDSKDVGQVMPIVMISESDISPRLEGVFEMHVDFSVTYSTGAGITQGSTEACGAITELAFDQILTLNYAASLREIHVNGCENEILRAESSALVIISEAWVCPDGYLASGADCVPCPPGYSNNMGTCERCGLGYYQDEQGQDSCKACPMYTTTTVEGAKAERECINQCPPGTMSATGYPPCTACPSGEYWNNSMSCIACDSGNGPAGAISADECTGACPAGHFSVDADSPCHPCPIGFYQDTTGQFMCTACGAGMSTPGNGSMASDCATLDNTANPPIVDPCDPDPCLDGTCEFSDTTKNAQCTCSSAEYMGLFCEIGPQDKCEEHTCRNGATCQVIAEDPGYECLCPIDDSIDMIETIDMEIDSSVSGVYSEAVSKDDCSTYCLNEATCMAAMYSPNSAGDYFCTYFNTPQVLSSVEGATGPVWSYLKEPRNVPLFEGTECETNIDDCAAAVAASDECHSTSQCIDGLGSIDCFCGTASTRYGDRCELEGTVCSGVDCSNQGTCIELPAPSGTAVWQTCDCNPGYTGVNCETEIDECSSSPCFAGADCNDIVNGFMCDCPSGFSGDRCEIQPTELDLCANVNCGTGTCYYNYPLSEAACICPVGTGDTTWTEWIDSEYDMVNSILEYDDTLCGTGVAIGIECRIKDSNDTWQDLNEHLRVPCIPSHGIVCFGADNDVTQSCKEYQARFLCQSDLSYACDDIDDCSWDPCRNGGSCSDELNGFNCDCAPGYEGAMCQHEIDECASEPCINAVSCENLINDYSCMCEAGWTGKDCEVNIDDCDCVNDNTINCEDLVEDYICNCQAGYWGKQCQDDIDECDSNPCLNEGVCTTETLAEFNCACTAGWTGVQCETPIGVCDESTCLNGGTCYNIIGGFYCSCQPGYYGDTCEIAPPLCDTADPCINGGTCMVVNGTAVCTCEPGFTGDSCECRLTACSANPCGDAGTCIDDQDSFDYTCECNDGFRYDDTTCVGISDEIIKVCDGVGEALLGCMNDGTCIDNPAGSSYCICPIGFEGRECEKATNQPRIMTLYASGKGEAELISPFAFDIMDFSVVMKVQFEVAQSTGTFFTLRSKDINTMEIEDILSFDETGVMFTASGQTVDWGVEINNGESQYLAFHWTSSGEVVTYASGSTIQDNVAYPSPPPSFVTIGLGGGMQGTIKEVRVYSGAITESDMAALQNNNPTSGSYPIIQEWQGYDYNGYVLRSFEDLDVSSQESDLSLGECPADLSSGFGDGTIVASYDEPVSQQADFEDTNLDLGEAVSVGVTDVIHFAEDTSSYKSCGFTYYRPYGQCSESSNTDPNLSCESNDFFGMTCTITCPDGQALLIESPKFYPCGPSGIFNIADPTLPFEFPLCGATETSSLAIDMGWTYELPVELNDATNTDLSNKLRDKFIELHNTYDGLGTGICADSTCTGLEVQLLPVPDTSYNYEAKFLINGVPSEIGGTTPTDTIKGLVYAALIDDHFSITDHVGAETFNEDTFYINSDTSCSPGFQVVSDNCVECVPGTFYNATTSSCDDCLKGSYQASAQQTTCDPCQIGQTTPSTRSTASTDCKDICPAGNFFSLELNQCTECGYGFYQPEEGQFSCLTCPIGKTTRILNATDVDNDCIDLCDSGYQQEGVASCAPCPRGFYRTKGEQVVCVECSAVGSTQYTTPNEGSQTADECTLVKCPDGQYRIGDDPGECQPCWIGSYRNGDMLNCTSCPEDHRTENMGSSTEADCRVFCNGGYYLNMTANITTCEPCEQDFYKSDTDYYATSCTPCPSDAPRTVDIATNDVALCRSGRCAEGQILNPAYDPMDTATTEPECFDCGYGYYQESTVPIETTECQQCPDGQSTETERTGLASECKDVCDSGYQWNDDRTECIPCERGYYKNNDEGPFNMCTLCPLDFTTTAGTVGTSVEDCNVMNCSAGTYLDTTTGNCILCAIGTYNDGSELLENSCTSCPTQPTVFSTPVTGSTSSDQCTLTPFAVNVRITIKFTMSFIPSYAIRSSSQYLTLQTSVVNALTGLVGNMNGFVRIRLLSFGPGSTNAEVELTTDTSGETQNMIDTIEMSVQSGFLNGDANLPTDTLFYDSYNTGSMTDICEPGKYLDYTTFGNICTDCPANSFNDVGSLCIPCEYSPNAGSATLMSEPGSMYTGCLLECGPGLEDKYYMTSLHTGGCQQCEPGYYKDTTGSTTCMQCLAPRIPSADSTQCIYTCNPGEYYDGTSCVTCPADSYSSGQEATCTQCDPNQYIPEGGDQTQASGCMDICDNQGREYCDGHGTCRPGLNSAPTCECDNPWEGDFCATRGSNSNNFLMYILGAIGGLVLLCLLIACCCLIMNRSDPKKRRRKHRPYRQNVMMPPQPTYLVEQPPPQVMYNPIAYQPTPQVVMPPQQMMQPTLQYPSMQGYAEDPYGEFPSISQYGGQRGNGGGSMLGYGFKRNAFFQAK